MTRSSEFSYTLDELRIVWDDRCESLDKCWTLIKWLKRRDLLDCQGAGETMMRIIDDMEEFGGPDGYIKKMESFSVKRVTPK